MKTALTYICLSAIFIYTLSGCCIHQWPEMEWEEEENPQECNMLLHLKFNPDIYVWEHTYNSETGAVTEDHPGSYAHPDHPGTTSFYDNTQTTGRIRHQVRVYRTGDASTPVKEIEVVNQASGLYDCDIPISLPTGKYDIVVWSDLAEEARSPHFYDTADFFSINLTTPHAPNTDYRDAFRGAVDAEVTPEANHEITVDMHRPMAKFEFISTGLEAFANREQLRTAGTRVSLSTYKVVFTYTNFVPCSYSAIDDRLVDSWTGLQFESAITQINDDEASFGFDYVMINSTLTKTAAQGVTVMVTVLDQTGEQVANSRPITVPLRRDDHTIIRSPFLLENSQGGVTIDPRYDGDHNIFM